MNKVRTNCKRERNLITLKGMKILGEKKLLSWFFKKHKLKEPRDVILKKSNTRPTMVITRNQSVGFCKNLKWN